VLRSPGAGAHHYRRAAAGWIDICADAQQKP